MDPLEAPADISRQLKPGSNEIQVRVATTLNNRMAKLDEAVANRGMVQPYGLLGPVTIEPYVWVPVWR